MIDNPIVTADTLGMTREQIINDSFPGFRSRFNYESSMIEIDAMRTSLIEAVQFFQDMETDITPDEVFQVMKEKEFFELIDQYGIDLVELGIKIGELCGWEGAHRVYEKEGQWIYYSAEQLNKTTYFEVLGAFNYLIYLRNKPQEALANLQKCLPRR